MKQFVHLSISLKSFLGLDTGLLYCACMFSQKVDLHNRKQECNRLFTKLARFVLQIKFFTFSDVIYLTLLFLVKRTLTFNFLYHMDLTLSYSGWAKIRTGLQQTSAIWGLALRFVLEANICGCLMKSGKCKARIVKSNYWCVNSNMRFEDISGLY